MHDFPPAVPELRSAAATSSPETAGPAVAPAMPGDRPAVFARPRTSGPARFLAWMLGQQRVAIVLAALTSMVEWLPGSVGPYLVGRVVDRGIIAGDLGEVLRLSLILLGLVLCGVLAGVLRHTLVVRSWLVALYGTTMLVSRKTTQLGHVLPRRTPTGEVLSVAASDADEFGALTEITSRFCGALMAYVLIAVLVLGTSPRLGAVVLLVGPMVVVCALPLLRPLQRREEVERTRSSDLTSLAVDIVAGLRILRGIGGEATFARNYATQSQRTREAGLAAGRWQAAVDATSVLFSGLFLLVLTWLGARQVLQGALTVGELVSFFGYAVFMVWPIQTFFELVQRWVRSTVSAAKAIAVLEQEPPWQDPLDPSPLPSGAELRDHRSGFVARPGELTAVVSARPEDAAELADRLGRYLPEEGEPVGLDVPELLKGRAARRARGRQRAARRERMARDRAQATGRWGVTLGPVDLGDAAIEDVRRRIVVSDSSSQVFAGTLQSAVDPHRRLSREQAEAVLHAAAAEDVFESLPGGWQGRVDERGRGLSGGQRQRLVLARVLGLNPDVLVLVEPTSAVDAHTEADIAERLRAHRRGRTTVVATGSPLLLHVADRVTLLRAGRVVATGTHAELLRDNPDYRAVVARAFDEPADEAGEPVQGGLR